MRQKKVDLPKYSSYLEEEELKILEDFCNERHCSKAKAMTLFLSDWKKEKESKTISINTSDNAQKITIDINLNVQEFKRYS